MSETSAIEQHAADVATSCAECGVTAMFCAKTLGGVCCEVCNHTELIVGLVKRTHEAEAASSHMHAVLIRAAPDADIQAALWREHWREQLAIQRAVLATPDPSPAS